MNFSLRIDARTASSCRSLLACALFFGIPAVQGARIKKGFPVSVWDYGIVGAGKSKERLEDMAAVWLQSECFFVDSRCGLDTDCCDCSLDALNSALVCACALPRVPRRMA
jgi:hypothetical protein